MLLRMIKFVCAGQALLVDNENHSDALFIFLGVLDDFKLETGKHRIETSDRGGRTTVHQGDREPNENMGC